MKYPGRQRGFSLVEMLVATTVFTFVAAGVSGLFVAALDIQRRAIGIQKIEENAQFVLESIAREVRVSVISSGDTNCNPPGLGTEALTIEHPVNGTVTYRYDKATGIGRIMRDAGGSGEQAITADDVNFIAFAFCVIGSGGDDVQARLTMPMTIQSITGRAANRAEVSLQSSVVSRDLSRDFAN